MGDLDPVAFDIETSGLGDDAVITVAGFAHQAGCWMVLNTGGREADQENLEAVLDAHADAPLSLVVVADEQALLNRLAEFVTDTLDGDRHYLTAYNGERWNGGFDLPFLRSACLRHSISWPFDDIAYADTMDAIERFDTDDIHDLVGVYETLVGDDDCDPFEDSGSAVTTWNGGDWEPLLLHNLADIQRTHELIVLAGEYVPKSDFSMKNLQPPN